MTAQNPQVFEPHLDLILAGTITEPSTLQSILRGLLVCRRRYNDPDQAAGRRRHLTSGGTDWPGGYDEATPNTLPDCLGGFVFSNYWTVASQKARVEQGIAFLMPLVGAAVGSYPPIVGDPAPDATHERVDTMGNRIPAGMP